MLSGPNSTLKVICMRLATESGVLVELRLGVSSIQRGATAPGARRLKFPVNVRKVRNVEAPNFFTKT
jgi:hypothetical protein